MGIFRREKTLTEKQEEDDNLDVELSIARKRAMIRELDAKAGKDGWKMFSSDGTKGGLDWGRIWRWLRTH